MRVIFCALFRFASMGGLLFAAVTLVSIVQHRNGVFCLKAAARGL